MDDKEFTDDDFLAIPTSLVLFGKGKKFDTYVKIESTGRYILFAKDGMIDESRKAKLVESGLGALYIQMADKLTYEQYIENNYGDLLLDENISKENRGKLLYDHSSDIIKAVFDSKLPENILDSEYIKKVNNIVDLNYKFLNSHKDVFTAVSKLISHNYKTYSHCVNVSIYAMCLMSAMDIKDRELIKQTGIGAMLHDIGKVKISRLILDKPDKLTDEEFKEIKKHPVHGMIVGKNLPITPIANQCIVFHHEKLDSSGYPNGLSDKDIPDHVKIVTICDIYDALVSDRPYCKGYTSFEALKIIMKDVEKNKIDKFIYAKFVKLLSGAKLIS